MSFEIIELFLVLGAIGLYGIGIVLWFRSRAISTGVMAAGLIVQGVAIAWRWYESGHLPIFGMFEAAMADSFVAVIVGLAAGLAFRKRAAVKFATPFSVAVAIAILIQGLFYSREMFPLTISETSLWVDFHAIFAWLTVGAYALSAGLSLGFVVKNAETGGLDSYGYRFLGWGFILHTVMILLGSFYEFLLFGTFWKWDPIEILALISWALYGLIIHMRLFYGWRDTRFAKLNLLSFAVLVISYKGLIYFPSWSTFHIFDIGIRMH